MGWVTTQEIEKARQIDLLTYLKLYDPSELVRIGNGIYSTRTHDSLKISNGAWMWFSRGIGGYSALDYLIKVKEIPFVEAVNLLNDKGAHIAAPLLHLKENFRIRSCCFRKETKGAAE